MFHDDSFHSVALQHNVRTNKRTWQPWVRAMTTEQRRVLHSQFLGWTRAVKPVVEPTLQMALVGSSGNLPLGLDTRGYEGLDVLALFLQDIEQV